MNPKPTKISPRLQKILPTVTVIASTALSVWGVISGVQAERWMRDMQSVSYALYPKETVLTLDKNAYETVPLPEGVNKSALYNAIDLAEYDAVLTTPQGARYLFFRDPLQTGEAVGLCVPLSWPADFWGELGEPFAYYVREVTEG